MFIIDDALSKSFHRFITENIETGSKIITDEWRGYNGIESLDYLREIHTQKDETDDEKMVTVKSHTVREGCSKGVGQSNHPGKGHTEYGQRGF